jgi:ABC-type sugar transport system permease subunit
MGYASAMTVVLFVMILAITVFQLKVLSRNNNDY